MIATSFYVKSLQPTHMGLDWVCEERRRQPARVRNERGSLEHSVWEAALHIKDSLGKPGRREEVEGKGAWCPCPCG